MIYDLKKGDFVFITGNDKIANETWKKSFPQNIFGKIININKNYILVRCYTRIGLKHFKSHKKYILKIENKMIISKYLKEAFEQKIKDYSENCWKQFNEFSQRLNIKINKKQRIELERQITENKIKLFSNKYNKPNKYIKNKIQEVSCVSNQELFDLLKECLNYQFDDYYSQIDNFEREIINIEIEGRLKEIKFL